jgi:hypothetical protein
VPATEILNKIKPEYLQAPCEPARWLVSFTSLTPAAISLENLYSVRISLNGIPRTGKSNTKQMSLPQTY